MEANDITIEALVACFLLLLIPLGISYLLNLRLIRETATSVSRMAVQLIFVGIFLTVLFDMNNSLVNMSWVMVMIVVATYTSIRDIELDMKTLFIPTFISFIVGNILVLMYFNAFVVALDNLFNARYLIPILGMFLGNSMSTNIVGISDFYERMKRNENRYMYSLSLGARQYEAVLPYVRQSLLASLRPSIARMSTIGIVTLPGMMTGQILGGSSPILAIKYQMAIMIGIFVSTVITITIGLFVSVKNSFDEYGILKKEIFIHVKKNIN